MEYDIYLRQLVALGMKRKPEMPNGYRRPKQGFDLKSPGMRKRQSTKKFLSPAKLKSPQKNEISDAKEGGESEQEEDDEEGEEQSGEQDSEYDDEDGSLSGSIEERELEWTKPNIVASKLLDDIDSDELEQQTGINKYDENEAALDNTEVVSGLLPPRIRFSDAN